MSDYSYTLRMPAACADWLRYGERGVSAETIVSVMTGLPISMRGHPSDPADLGRCRKLLECVPKFEGRLHEMKNESRQWRVLVENWQELCALMDEEAPDWRDGQGSAPRTYERMKELIR